MAYPSSWDFEDAFSGTSADPIDNHTPTVSGEAWSSPSGNVENLATDSTNALVYHGSTGGFQFNGALAIVDSGGTNNGWNDDHFAEAQWSAVSPTAKEKVAVRCTPDGGNEIEGYGAFYNSGGSTWQVLRHDQVATTTQLDVYFDAGATATDFIGIDAVGSTMSLYLNGSDVSSSPTTDTTYTSGTPGIIGNKSGSSSQGITYFRAAGASGEPPASTPKFLTLLGVG